MDIENSFVLGGDDMENVESEDIGNVEVDMGKGFDIRLAEFHVELNLEGEIMIKKSTLRQISESFLKEIRELDDVPSIIIRPRR